MARARAAKQDEAVHEAHTRGSFGSVCKVYERTLSYLTVCFTLFFRPFVYRYPPFYTERSVCTM